MKMDDCKHIIFRGPLIFATFANFEKIATINGRKNFEYIEFEKFWQPIGEH